MKGTGGSQAVVVIMVIALLAAAAYIAGYAYHSGDHSKWFRPSSRVRQVEKMARMLKMTK